MRTIRVAALTAAVVGLGLFAAGCGPQPSTGNSPAGGTQKTAATTGATGTKPTTGGDLAGKVKAATDDVNKELTPLKGAFEKLKAKVADDEKTAGADAAKLTKVFDLKKTRDDADNLLKDIDGKVGGLAGVKDEKGLEEAKKAITERVEKVKPLLKDYMPAK